MERRIQRLRKTRNTILKYFPSEMKIAEIGVYRGAYSKNLIKTQPAELYLVDIWRHVDDGSIYSELDGCNDSDARHALNKKRVEEYFAGFTNVHVVQSDGVEFSKTLPDGYLDCVYIDGDHTYEGCLRDLRAFSGKINSTGFMYGHDYTNNYAWIQVPEAINDFLKEDPSWKLEYITCETPEKSPSWFLLRDTSKMNEILKKLI